MAASPALLEGCNCLAWSCCLVQFAIITGLQYRIVIQQLLSSCVGYRVGCCMGCQRGSEGTQLLPESSKVWVWTTNPHCCVAVQVCACAGAEACLPSSAGTDTTVEALQMVISRVRHCGLSASAQRNELDQVPQPSPAQPSPAQQSRLQSAQGASALSGLSIDMPACTA
jgi:hypothetical protein